nr:cell wall-binding repeat-containing protein [Kineococcus aurantiacus]
MGGNITSHALEAIVTAATSRLRRRGIGAGVAALVGLGSIAGLAGAAQAAPGFDPSAASSRLAGVDRYDTAAKAALAGWTTASTVIVANGEVTGIDALAASYLAGVKDAPILLTQKDSVPSQTAAAIASLNPTTVIVLGDTNAVSASTYTALVGSKTGQRIDGPNRFQTAVDIMTEAGVTPPKTVFLARGDQYGVGQVAADALAAGPAAFKNKIPVLLTNQDSLPAETLAALNTAGVTKVYVLGNANAVSDAVYTQVDGLASVTDIERIQGSDRTATAAAIANETDFGFNKTGAALANGFRIDALAAGPVVGKAGSPILLTEGTVGLGVGTEAYLTANAATLTKAWVFGDENSVTSTIAAAATTAAKGGTPTSNQTITVSPTEASTISLSADTTSRQYTATGLTADTEYTVALVNADDITTTANGVVSFADDDDTDQYETGSVAAAEINVINGTAVAGTDELTAEPVNGQISFTVNGTAYGDVVPVVFVDSDEDGDIALGADAVDTPTEAFGLGGVLSLLPAERATAAALGADFEIAEIIPNGDVTSLVLDSDTTAATGTFSIVEINANDRYFLGSTEVVAADFFEQLSVGDELDTTTSYNATPALQSTFVLTDLTPEPPTLTGLDTAGLTVDDVAADDVTDTTADLEVSNLSDDVSSVTVYYIADTNDDTVTALDTDTFESRSFTADSDTSTDNWDITLTGLDDDTSYDVYVTQTVGQEESEPSDGFELTTEVTNTDNTAPTIEDTVLTDDNGTLGVLDSADVVTLTFSESMASTLGDAGTFLRFSDGDSTYQVSGGFAQATDTDTDDQLVITVPVAGATFGLVAGEDNGLDVAGDSVKVSLVSSQFDDVAGNQLNLAGSADVTVDDES